MIDLLLQPLPPNVVKCLLCIAIDIYGIAIQEAVVVSLNAIEGYVPGGAHSQSP